MNRAKFLLQRLGETLWVRAALYAVLGITTALAAAFFSSFVPDSLAKPFGGGTVTGLMNILASSLLAVAIFSVTALLAAFTNVSGGATPRAARLVAGNRPAQGALSTFVGAFLYAVVGYSALGTGYYAEGGRAILFFVTLVVLAIVAVTLLRWLDQLLKLARVDHAVSAVEQKTAAAMRSVFGASASGRALPPRPAEVAAVKSDCVGYVQNVDIEALRRLAERERLRIWVEAAPGCLVLSDTCIASIEGEAGPTIREEVHATFTLEPERSFSQDPQYGLIVLGEIAAKALSPGVNNPGLAKDVITSAVRLLEQWMLASRPSSAPDGRVYWTGPTFEALLEDALLPVAIHGASSVMVAVRLQNVLSALRRSASPAEQAALDGFARESLDRSNAALSHAPDRARIEAAAAGIMVA